MKRGLLAAFCSVAVWLGAVGIASADDAGGAGFGKTGGLGVGGSLSDRGASGLSVYFVPAARIGIQGVLHFESSSGDAPSTSEFGITVNGLYSLISDGGFELPALVGLDFSNSSEEDADGNSESTNGVALQLGLQPAWWPTPALSFHISLALLIDLAGNRAFASSGVLGGIFGFGDSPGEGTTIAFPGTTEIVGGAGITFWIK